MVFDIYVPTLGLAFEYQGRQHYKDHLVYGATKEYKDRDEEKRQRCSLAQITLIEVPYWWRHDKESIVAILHKYRPDITSHSDIATPFMYEPL